MRFLVAILLLQCIYSTAVPSLNISKNQPITEMKQVNNKEKSESNLSHCGTFTSGCFEMQGLSSEHLVISRGSAKGNPTKLSVIFNEYKGNCKGTLTSKTRYDYSIKNTDGNNYSTKITDIFLVFSETTIKYSGCTNVNAGEEFSATKGNCVMNGEDRLAMYKKQIGTEGTTTIEFINKGIKYEKRDYDYVNDEGCRMATSLIVIIVIVAIVITALIIFIAVKYFYSNNMVMKKATK